MKCFKIDFVPGATSLPGVNDWIEIDIFDFNHYLSMFHYGSSFGGDKCLGLVLADCSDIEKGAPYILIYQVRSDEDMAKLLNSFKE